MASVPPTRGTWPSLSARLSPSLPWGPRAFLSLQAGKLGFPSWEHKGAELLEPGKRPRVMGLPAARSGSERGV